MSESNYLAPAPEEILPTPLFCHLLTTYQPNFENLECGLTF